MRLVLGLCSASPNTAHRAVVSSDDYRDFPATDRNIGFAIKSKYAIKNNHNILLTFCLFRVLKSQQRQKKKGP